MIVVGDSRVRITKAEGRPPGIEGSVFRYPDSDGLRPNGRPVLRRGEVLLIDATTLEGWHNLGPSEATLFWILRD